MSAGTGGCAASHRTFSIKNTQRGHFDTGKHAGHCHGATTVKSAGEDPVCAVLVFTQTDYFGNAAEKTPPACPPKAHTGRQSLL